MSDSPDKRAADEFIRWFGEMNLDHQSQKHLRQVITRACNEVARKLARHSQIDQVLAAKLHSARGLLGESRLWLQHHRECLALETHTAGECDCGLNAYFVHLGRVLDE